jgi:hypothetical protein
LPFLIKHFFIAEGVVREALLCVDILYQNFQYNIAQKNPPEKISKLGRYWSATVNIFTFFIFAFNMGIFTLKESGKEASLLFSLIRFAGWFDSWLLYWFLTTRF